MLFDQERKQQKIEYFNQLADKREKWRDKNQYYYTQLEQFLINKIGNAHSVLEIGCGIGTLLSKIKAPKRVGIDFSPEMIKVAQQSCDTEISFKVDDIESLQMTEQFDYVIMSDVCGELDDIWTALHNIQQVTHQNSRIIITFFNHLWEPILRLGEKLGLKTPQYHQNWLSLTDMENQLHLSGFEKVQKGYRLLFPKNIPILSNFF
ncbi:MAG: methyltransferase domain-containing protein, partial [Thiomargarita sp.]|nr:methyltransferase domain-containing protein [Thiomargarita sp.]